MISLVLKKGNEVLKMEADLLKAQCGEGSVHGRTGGDKFAILGKTMINQLHTIATRYFMILLPKKQLVGDF